MAVNMPEGGRFKSEQRLERAGIGEIEERAEEIRDKCKYW